MKKRTSVLWLSLGIAILAFQSCGYFRCIDGIGEVIKVKRDVEKFNGIVLKGSANVYVKQGNNQSVVVESNEDLQSLIETDVDGSTLYLSTKRNICPSALNIFIVVKDINEIAIRGSGNIQTGSQIKTDNLKVSINGSGDVKMDVSAKMLMLKINGSGDVKLKGDAELASFAINGSGDINAFGLKVRAANVAIRGSGDVRINAVEELEVHVSGSGDVEYTGSPEKIIADVRGSGSVRKR